MHPSRILDSALHAALRRAGDVLRCPILAALAVVAVVTSFISGIFGMAGGMLLIGFLLVMLPVPVAMVFHGVIQIAANGWRVWLWRHHINWSVVLQFGLGSALLAGRVLVLSTFVPPKSLVLMAVGLTPFVALAVPQTLAPNIERARAGLPGRRDRRRAAARLGRHRPDARHLLCPHRHDAAGQCRRPRPRPRCMGHLTKVIYFGVADRRSGRPRLGAVGWSWPLPRSSPCSAPPCRAVSSTGMSDKQFYHWTRRVILALGAVYIAQGVWQMVQHDDADRPT